MQFSVTQPPAFFFFFFWERVLAFHNGYSQYILNPNDRENIQIGKLLKI